MRSRIVRAFTASQPKVGVCETETAHRSCPRIQRLSNLGRSMLAWGSAKTGARRQHTFPLVCADHFRFLLPTFPGSGIGEGGHLHLT
jgi:hypothetical protein